MPENENFSLDEFYAGFEQIVNKYGKDKIAKYVTDYLDKMSDIAYTTNEAAISVESKDEKTYNDSVNKVLEATNSFYSFMGKMPRDIRAAFSLPVNISGAEIYNYFTTIPSLKQEIEAQGKFEFTIQSIRPKNYIMQVDAITNQLVNLGPQNFVKVGGHGNQPIRTAVTLDIPEHMRIEGGGALSTYDKSIINGVTSLIESGNTVFSVPMLYHAMTGKNNPTVDEQLTEEISMKLEKMRRTMISIDLTEENTAHYVKDENGNELKIEDVKLEGYLLPLQKITGQVNGKRSEMYQILNHPPLYSYSKMKRQLASVPITLLGAPVNNNSTTIPLKTYLLQRIELMRNQNNNIVSNTILYDSIYKELGAEDGNKTRKMRIRTYTETILDYFVEKEYITGYNQFKKGRHIAGLDIIIPNYRNRNN